MSVTVLVVEDESALSELYQDELEAEGYEVIRVPSGAEAIRVVSERRVHVVVLDIAMPGMDGIEALGRILSVDNCLPVILNTAFTGYQENFLTWAAEAYVVKSSDLSELKQRLAEALVKRGVAPPAPGEA
jgi:two-component system response regulator (stage 0 sporulation protein F)